MDDREQEDFILLYGWWTNEIEFNRENFQCYARELSYSLEHYKIEPNKTNIDWIISLIGVLD